MLFRSYSVSDLTCVHVDLYRLQSPAEVEELGLRDLIGPGYLMVIEWPEKGGRAVPPPDLILRLQYAGEARTAAIDAGSDAGRSWVSKLAIDTSLAPYVSNMT